MTHFGNNFEKSTTETNNNKNGERRTTEDSIINNIIIRDTEPGVFYAKSVIGDRGKISQAEVEEIKRAYAENIGQTIPAPVAHFFEELFEEGFDYLLIIEAIERTGWAQRPSPAYMRAIIRRWQAEGIKTRVQLLHREYERGNQYRW